MQGIVCVCLLTVFQLKIQHKNIHNNFKRLNDDAADRREVGCHAQCYCTVQRAKIVSAFNRYTSNRA